MRRPQDPEWIRTCAREGQDRWPSASTGMNPALVPIVRGGTTRPRANGGKGQREGGAERERRSERGAGEGGWREPQNVMFDCPCCRSPGTVGVIAAHGLPVVVPPVCGVDGAVWDRGSPAVPA